MFDGKNNLGPILFLGILFSFISCQGRWGNFGLVQFLGHFNTNYEWSFDFRPTINRGFRVNLMNSRSLLPSFAHSALRHIPNFKNLICSGNYWKSASSHFQHLLVCVFGMHLDVLDLLLVSGYQKMLILLYSNIDCVKTSLDGLGK